MQREILALGGVLQLAPKQIYTGSVIMNTSHLKIYQIFSLQTEIQYFYQVNYHLYNNIFDTHEVRSFQ